MMTTTTFSQRKFPSPPWQIPTAFRSMQMLMFTLNRSEKEAVSVEGTDCITSQRMRSIPFFDDLHLRQQRSSQISIRNSIFGKNGSEESEAGSPRSRQPGNIQNHFHPAQIRKCLDGQAQFFRFDECRRFQYFDTVLKKKNHQVFYWQTNTFLEAQNEFFT